MKKQKAIIAAIFGLVMVGCATTQTSDLTPLEIQSMQTRRYENEKEVVFPSVVSVFQDLGYSIQNADIQSGLISAESAAEDNPALTFWTGQTQVKQTRATAFVEQIHEETSVRLNFVEVDRTSSAYGRDNRRDTPILDADLYQNAFERIENAIFVRAGD